MTDLQFTGIIERIIFENPSNFYKIVVLEIDTASVEYEDDTIIVTGTMAELIEGEEYTFYGNLVTHPKYGQQLQVSRYERAKPSETGLIRYFSSEQFKGIGKKTAEKIVQLYGENTIDQILANPDKLKTITGLSASHRQAFLETLQLNYGTERILATLASYGIPNKLAFQIQDKYKEQTLVILEENPYQLVEDIQGMGFTLADRLAQEIGITADAPQRLRAGLLHTLLHRSIETGDTYVEARDLLESSLDLLEKARPIELEPAAVASQLTQLISEGKLQQVDTKIFDNSLFFAEEGIAKHLKRIKENPDFTPFPEEDALAAIAHVEKEAGIHYDDTQRAAILAALQNPVFVLTGGPGTGKTTIINGFIAAYGILHHINLSAKDCPILLAAPTGRAARRMNELTGLASATIHRHLGLTDGQTESYLDDYLDAQLIIIDEFSMVDTWLAHQLLQHIATQTQLLIVGDAEQLPSVSPGQVLADILAVPDLPSMRLETIYRQSTDSTIVTLANHIRQGHLPADFTSKQADRSYFETTSEQIPALIERIVSAAISSGIPASEVQILAPMYRGAAGIDQLNRTCQALLNPLPEGSLEFTALETTYRQGDRVLHLVNDAESNVFNGDLGYITDLLPAKYTDSKQDEITIQFDGGEITYPRNEWYKINLAYAMSIHKSQGSEFQVVILPLTRASHRMLQRNLLYTAITRSKSKLILLGEQAAFVYAVEQIGTARKTYLRERFGTTTSTTPPATTPTSTYRLTEDNYLTIDPMIGITQEDIEAFFRPVTGPF